METFNIYQILVSPIVCNGAAFLSAQIVVISTNCVMMDSIKQYFAFPPYLSEKQKNNPTTLNAVTIIAMYNIKDP